MRFKLLENITVDDVLTVIDDEIETSSNGAEDLALLFPNGRLVDITDWGNHFDFDYELTDYLDYNWSDDPTDELVDDFGIITLNSGNNTDDWRTKITLSVRPTQKQFNRLEDWLESHWDVGDDKVFVWCNGSTHRYIKSSSAPRDIIKSIQEYFISGVLDEKFSIIRK